MMKKYQSVRALSNILQVFENILNRQISTHFEIVFSIQQTGFCRGFKSQHRLFLMLEIFRKALGTCGDYATLVTDLSKTFDC